MQRPIRFSLSPPVPVGTERIGKYQGSLPWQVKSWGRKNGAPLLPLLKLLGQKRINDTEKLPMRCTFVYFDAGFTLIKPNPSVGYHYAEVARRYGIEADPGRIDAAFPDAWRTARRTAPAAPGVPYGRNIEEAITFWTVVVENAFRGAGFEPPPRNSSYYRTIFHHFAHPECWKLYPDVEPALDLLDAEGLRYGVLSNFDPRIHQILEGLGLKQRLARLLTSSEIGSEKPAPALFERARQMLSGEEALRPGLIGDEPDADGFGAFEAGWKQCLVIRKGDLPTHPELRAERDLISAVKALIR